MSPAVPILTPPALDRTTSDPELESICCRSVDVVGGRAPGYRDLCEMTLGLPKNVALGELYARYSLLDAHAGNSFCFSTKPSSSWRFHGSIVSVAVGVLGRSPGTGQDGEFNEPKIYNIILSGASQWPTYRRRWIYVYPKFPLGNRPSRRPPLLHCFSNEGEEKQVGGFSYHRSNVQEMNV